MRTTSNPLLARTRLEKTLPKKSEEACCLASNSSASVKVPRASAQTQRSARTRSQGNEAMQARLLSGLLNRNLPSALQKPTDLSQGGVLDVGSKDPAVAEVQQHLRKLGFNAPNTGVFDKQTKAAVDSYQRANKLTPPPGMQGVVGETTLNFLRGAARTPSLEGVRNGEMMTLGASGDSVVELQKMLGFGEGGQSGVLGQTTLSALETFQKEQGLEGRGGLDATTLERLEQQKRTNSAPAATTNAVAGGALTTPTGVAISADGQAQMQRMLSKAKGHSEGYPPDGRCYFHVANYIDELGYGGLSHVGSQLPGDKLGLARHFAEHMNGPGNAERAGLQRIDNAVTPPIESPYDSRIPAGAIVVVPPGVPGTAHPTAGDIAIADGGGRFFNGGEMG